MCVCVSVCLLVCLTIALLEKTSCKKILWKHLWKNPISSNLSLLNNSNSKWCSLYICSKLNSFAKKIPFDEKNETQDICQFEIFLCLLISISSKKLLFANIYFLKPDKNILFVYINFRELSKKIGKIESNLERFLRCGKISTIIQKTLFKNKFENQTLECLLA